MAIFGEKTLAEKQAAAKAWITNASAATLNQLVAGIESIFEFLWNNRDGLSPQEVCDALGTDAASLFILFGTMKATINSVKPGALTLSAPFEFTINEDGTVTIVIPEPSGS